MDPREKIIEDYRYWFRQVKQAEETLKFGRPLLASLENTMNGLGIVVDELKTPSDMANLEVHAGAEPPPTDSSDEPNFSGLAADQVWKALQWKSPQSSDDLVNNLRKYGTPFSRGAIGYAIRDLRKTNRIRKSHKQGNLWFYEPVEQEGEPM